MKFKRRGHTSRKVRRSKGGWRAEGLLARQEELKNLDLKEAWGKDTPRYPSLKKYPCKKTKGEHLLVRVDRKSFLGFSWENFFCTECGKKVIK